MNAEIMEKLKEFVITLKLVKRQPADLFDLGLIVEESRSALHSQEIFEEIKKTTPIKMIVYDSSVVDEDVIQQIIDAFQKKEWLFLEIKKDIKNPLLNQLKHLANTNSLQLIDFNDQDILEMKMPEDSRIIVFAKRNFIENKISYPHFYRIFGPVLSLE